MPQGLYDQVTNTMFTQQHDSRPLEEIQREQRLNDELRSASEAAQAAAGQYKATVGQDHPMNEPADGDDANKSARSEPTISTVERPKEKF